MARPRAFDPNCALDAALGAFGRHGYEATSVQDLVDATGLSRSSLYATFGDKHRLYLAALDRYGRTGGDHLKRLVAEAPDPLAGIRAYLDASATSRGCFTFNAAAERAATDPDTAARASTSWCGLQSTFAHALRQAQSAGDLPAERDSEALATTLAATVYGMRGMQNAGAPRTACEQVAATAFEALVGV